MGKLLILSKQITPPNATVHVHPPIFTHSCSPTDFHPSFSTHQVSENSEGVLADVCQRLLFLNKNNLSCLRVVIHGRPIIVLHPLLSTRWAFWLRTSVPKKTLDKGGDNNECAICQHCLQFSVGVMCPSLLFGFDFDYVSLLQEAQTIHSTQKILT